MGKFNREVHVLWGNHFGGGPVMTKAYKIPWGNGCGIHLISEPFESRSVKGREMAIGHRRDAWRVFNYSLSNLFNRETMERDTYRYFTKMTTRYSFSHSYKPTQEIDRWECIPVNRATNLWMNDDVTCGKYAIWTNTSSSWPKEARICFQHMCGIYFYFPHSHAYRTADKRLVLYNVLSLAVVVVLFESISWTVYQWFFMERGHVFSERGLQTGTHFFVLAGHLQLIANKLSVYWIVDVSSVLLKIGSSKEEYVIRFYRCMKS